MKVLKFGGSSVNTPDCVRRVIHICREEIKKENIILVFSAYADVTNQLVEMSKMASIKNEDYINIYEGLKQRVLTFPESLLSHQQLSDLKGDLLLILDELRDKLDAIYALGECSPKTQDLIVGFGEIISSKTITEAFINSGIQATFVDARNFICTDDTYTKAKVNFKQTKRKIKDYFEEKNGLQIVTGFIGKSHDGFTTTLGRGGSDYTASIIGSILKASKIEVWKDVDGIMTANPHIVKDAKSIMSLTYNEAMELSNFGAQVIYAPTVIPAMLKNIPIIVKNTFNPSFAGTVISHTKEHTDDLITSMTTINDISILRIEGGGMVGRPGMSKKVFQSLADENINVISIVQGGSEHSICVAIKSSIAQKAKTALIHSFEKELKDHIIDEVILEDKKIILTLVGEGMKEQVGIAGKVFSALAKYDINISGIAQGSSETSISCFLDQVNEIKALRAVHQEFFTKIFDLNLYIVGVGTVGKELFDLIFKNRKRILKDLKIRLNVMGIANSKHMIVAADELSHQDFQGLHIEGDYRTYLSANSQANVSLPEFIQQIDAQNLPNTLFVDCTSSGKVVKYYTDILSKSIHIVTPNKKANTEEYPNFKLLKNLAEKHQVRFYYETNVGASLPIIKTIQSIIGAGDKITKIEAILSGTISYIFNHLDASKKFSSVVKEAQQLGFTEPNPAEDLNGLDFARKLLILSREIGHSTELPDIQIEPLISETAVQATDAETFYQALEKESDTLYAKKLTEAEKVGKKLKYIGYIVDDKCSVSLEAIDATHPFYNLSYNDNIICIYTYCYNVNPLVIQGAGAGGLTTASGVLQDILSVAK